MTYRGHIENGRIVLDEPADLPEGGRVTVHVHVEASSHAGPPPQGRFRDLFGSVQSGDSSSADNARIDADLARAYEDMHQDGA